MIENGAIGILDLKTMKVNDALNAWKNIIDNSFQIIDYNIEKKLLEKSQYMVTYKKEESIKLIKEFDLIEKMKCIEEDKELDINSITGILISKEINSPSNPLTDKYSVDIIY